MEQRLVIVALTAEAEEVVAVDRGLVVEANADVAFGGVEDDFRHYLWSFRFKRLNDLDVCRANLRHFCVMSKRSSGFLPLRLGALLIFSYFCNAPNN